MHNNKSITRIRIDIKKGNRKQNEREMSKKVIDNLYNLQKTPFFAIDKQRKECYYIIYMYINLSATRLR